MQNFRNLKVWLKAHYIVLAIYKITKDFPKYELYGLTNQIRRAATSIPANIAEGCCRKTPNDFSRFLQIAIGSSSELEYLLFLAFDLTYLEKTKYKFLCNKVIEIKRMTTSFISKLRTDS